LAGADWRQVRERLRKALRVPQASLGDLLAACRDAVKPEAREYAREALQDELAARAEPEPDWDALAAEVEGAASDSERADLIEARLAGREPAPPLRAQSLDNIPSDDLPHPVLIWGQESSGAVLTGREVCVLAGPGGAGKSSLSLQWALAGARPYEEDDPRHGGEANRWYVSEAGLKVRRGPAVVAVWEDDPSILRRRIENLWPDEFPPAFRIIGMRGRPLFGPPAAPGEGPQLVNAVARRQRAWAPFWRLVRAEIAALRESVFGGRCGPGMVVLDPASCAYLGNNNEGSAVRAFLDAARLEVREAGIGILVVAHPSKAGSRQGAEGAESVGGSPAWHDAARGVLKFGRKMVAEQDEITGKPKPVPSPTDFELTVVKANYGDAWGKSCTLRRIPLEQEGGGGADAYGGGPFGVSAWGK